MKRIFLLSVVFLSFVAIPTATGAWPSAPKIPKVKIGKKKKPLDKKHQDMVDKGNASLDEIVLNKAYLKEVKPDELKAVEEHLAFVTSKINGADVFKRMDYKYKNHEDVKKLRKRTEEMTAYKSAVKAKYTATKEKVDAEQASLEASRQKFKESARAFNEVNSSYAMKQFIPFLSDEGAKAFDGRLTVQVYREKDVVKHKEAAAKLLAACEQERFTYQSTEHLTADVMKYDEELVKACKVSKEIVPVLKRVYLYELAKTDASVVKRINEAIKNAEEGQGWLAPLQAVNVLRILNDGSWPANVNMDWVTEKDKDVAGMCKAIGIPMLSEPFPARNAAYKKLAKIVAEQVKSWGRWPADGTFKESAAHKALKSSITKPEKVLKVGMHSKAWSIKKNALGVILSRSKMGYSITSVKGDALCRLQEFRYTENYSGGGRYQKSPAVFFNEGIKLVSCK